MELKFEPGKEYSKPCIDKINGNWVSIKKEITELIGSLPDSIAVIQTTNNNSLASNHDNTTFTNSPVIPPGGRVFFGVVTLLAGVVAGIVTIVDANSSTNVSSAGYSIKVQNQWTKTHTIEISLSIGMIAAGIGLLCK